MDEYIFLNQVLKNQRRKGKQSHKHRQIQNGLLNDNNLQNSQDPPPPPPPIPKPTSEHAAKQRNDEKRKKNMCSTYHQILLVWKSVSEKKHKVQCTHDNLVYW